MKHAMSALGVFFVSSFASASSLEDEAVLAVKMNLIDPDSMQVRSVESVELCDREYVEVVYNAKNRMGGYNGFTSLYYNPRSGKLTEDGRAADQLGKCDYFMYLAGDISADELDGVNDLSERETAPAFDPAKEKAEADTVIEEIEQESAADFMKKLFGE